MDSNELRDNMVDALDQAAVEQMIETKAFSALKLGLVGMEIHELAEFLGDLDPEPSAVCLRLLPTDIASEIFGELPFEMQESVLDTLSSETISAILQDMPPDERTELLEELPGRMAQRLVQMLKGQERDIARRLLAYPPESIGRLMTPEYLSFRDHWTIEMVLRHIRKKAESKETINVLYVVDDKGLLKDELSLEQIVLADPEDLVSDLMDEHVAALVVTDDEEEAIEVFRKYDALAMPVVDSAGVLVGIVTVDDILDVAEEEHTEDYTRLAGMDPLEHSYFGTNLFGMLKKRLPWLIMLLFAQSLTAVALNAYDSIVEFATLVVFVPMINSPAGNAGTQMASLVLRGLAVQEMDLGDWLKVLSRELLRGVALGAVMSMVGYGIILTFGRGHEIALAVALAILIAVAFANLVGSMLPFFFKRLGVDPAVTSGPFIASVMDVSAILIYFTLATTILAIAK